MLERLALLALAVGGPGRHGRGQRPVRWRHLQHPQAVFSARPSSSFQALQHRMADLLLEVEQPRSTVINARPLPSTTPGGPALPEASCAAYKYTVGRVGYAGGRGEHPDAIGGIGMTWELAPGALGAAARR